MNGTFPRALRRWTVIVGLLLCTACGGSAVPSPDAGGADAGGPIPDGGAPIDGGAVNCPLPTRNGTTINPGWIGGPCSSDADCDFADGTCLTAADGFPGGMCTKPCTDLCPDRFGPDDTATFCVAGAGRLAGTGMCVSQCDFQREPLGCRSGYACGPATRASDTSVRRNVCQPGQPVCYQQASSLCLDYRAASNPLSSPSDCPNELCDVRDALYLKSPVGGVVYRNSAGNASDLFVSCRLALVLEELGPILRAMNVAEVNHLGTYNCRKISGTNCSLSQHALGAAIDIASFKLQSGQVISVVDHWEPVNSVPIEPSASNRCRFDYTPTSENAQFLYEVVYRMCDAGLWSILLTPNYNAPHDNHFHLDITPGYSRSFLGSRPASRLEVNRSGE